VLGAHVHHTLETEPRADGGGRDAVLTRAGLGHDPSLAEPGGEHRLAERVVQLVRAGVEEVLALEGDPVGRVEPLRPGQPGGAAGAEAMGKVERGGAAGVGREQLVLLLPVGLVGARRDPTGGELVERRDQRLRDVPAAVDAERRAQSFAGGTSRFPRFPSTGPLSKTGPFAAATQARTASWSLIPGSLSVERAQSTAHGRTAAIASATLAASSPPASMTRPSCARARSRCCGSSSSQGRSSTAPTFSPCRFRTPSRERCPSSRA